MLKNAENRYLFFLYLEILNFTIWFPWDFCVHQRLYNYYYVGWKAKNYSLWWIILLQLDERTSILFIQLVIWISLLMVSYFLLWILWVSWFCTVHLLKLTNSFLIGIYNCTMQNPCQLCNGCEFVLQYYQLSSCSPVSLPVCHCTSPFAIVYLKVEKDRKRKEIQQTQQTEWFVIFYFYYFCQLWIEIKYNSATHQSPLRHSFLLKSSSFCILIYQRDKHNKISFDRFSFIIKSSIHCNWALRLIQTAPSNSVRCYTHSVPRKNQNKIGLQHTFTVISFTWFHPKKSGSSKGSFHILLIAKLESNMFLKTLLFTLKEGCLQITFVKYSKLYLRNILNYTCEIF